MEFYENYTPPPNTEWPKKAMPIYSYHIAVSVLHFLLIAQQTYKISEISDPIALNLTLGNAAPSYIHPYSRNYHLPDDSFIWQDELLSIDMTISELDNTNGIASDLMDRFFNAYGYEQNLHFNDKKELLRNR